jgi:hypothetical protein
MILTKIYHVEVWYSPKCTPEGPLEYGSPRFELYDAGQYLKRTQQLLLPANLARFRGRRSGGAAPPVADAVFYFSFGGSASPEGSASGPQFLLLRPAQDRRRHYTFVTPQLPAGGFGPDESPRRMFAAISGAPAFPGVQSQPAEPPGPVLIYRVGAPITRPQATAAAATQNCRGGGGGGGGASPLKAHKAGEWQFWVYEQPGFRGSGRGIWTAEQLCEMGPDSLPKNTGPVIT